MKRRRDFKRILLTTIILLITFFCCAYILVINTEAYKEAVNQLKNDKKTLNTFGHPLSLTLAFLGYDISTSGTSGNAEFEINIQGKRNDGVIFIELNKRNGFWVVVNKNITVKKQKIN